MLIRPPVGSPLGDNPILQEIWEDGSLSVLAENDNIQELRMESGALVGSVQEVTSAPSEVEADSSPPPEASTHKDFDALPQNAKIKWLVAHFQLNESPLLQRDSHLWKEVIRVLLQFGDVISIGGYGETNLISHAITVDPGTTPIKMKHRQLNPVMEESLKQQIDRRLVMVVLRVELIEIGENPEAFLRIFSQKVMFWARKFCIKKMTQKNEMKNFMMDLGVDVNYLRFRFKVRIFNYGICDFYFYDKKSRSKRAHTCIYYK